MLPGKPVKAIGLACILLCVSVCLISCSGSEQSSNPLKAAHTLYVAHDAVLVSYDIATGQERPGTVTNLATPTDMQALEDGKVIVNLTGLSQILTVDGSSMLEAARLPSSNTGGTRPVHSYISPVRNGKRYWLALNDGAGSVASTSKATFVDLT